MWKFKYFPIEKFFIVVNVCNMVKREKNYGMGFEERHERRSNSRADVSSQCGNYENFTLVHF